jgi:hypothetical protein
MKSEKKNVKKGQNVIIKLNLPTLIPLLLEDHIIIIIKYLLIYLFFTITLYFHNTRNEKHKLQ